LIEAAFSSAAATAIVPLQDLLRLDTHARMNLPGRASGNWGWRYQADQLRDDLADQLRDLTELYGRVGFAILHSVDSTNCVSGCTMR